MYIFRSIPSNNLLQSLFDGLESLQFLPQLEPEQQPQQFFLKKYEKWLVFIFLKFFKSRETPKIVAGVLFSLALIIGSFHTVTEP